MAKNNYITVWNHSFRKLRESLLNEAIPLIEKSYNVVTEKNSGAIAGLSLGRLQSFIFGPHLPEIFTRKGKYNFRDWRRL
jgi:enterochelin esterase-like enzyme